MFRPMSNFLNQLNCASLAFNRLEIILFNNPKPSGICLSNRIK